MRKEGGPWKFDRWSNELTRISQLFMTGRRNDTHIFQVYSPSIPRLLIGDYVGQCVPEDGARPP